MAEVYGIKPKKFTKEWWPYFWEYYKWHTIGIAFVIVAILFTVYQKATAPRYDLSMTYAGELALTDESCERIGNDMAAYIEDIDGNGECAIRFGCYTYTGLPGNEEFDSAMLTKLDMEYYDENSYIFIFDENIMTRQFNNEYYDQIYDSVDEWAQELPSEDKLHYFGDKAYAVKLTDSTYLKSNNFTGTDKMYAVLRSLHSDEESEIKAYEESKKILNELIK